MLSLKFLGCPRGRIQSIGPTESFRNLHGLIQFMNPSKGWHMVKWAENDRMYGPVTWADILNSSVLLFVGLKDSIMTDRY